MNSNPRQQGQTGSAGIVISALRGGSGKTILSVGIIAALRRRGYSVAPFKKGPDYIDAGWLALAAGRPCYNLDSFLVDGPTLRRSYDLHTRGAHVAVVEGNRGLYDAPETTGHTSTAELAKLLGLPVLLSIDCTKTTRTMAAVVAGCEMFDPDVNIRGVILNRVAGTRHESILRRSIEGHCGIPVIGAVPTLGEQAFPERHMGLVPTAEHEWALASVESAARMAVDCLDLDAVATVSGAPGFSPEHPAAGPAPSAPAVNETTTLAGSLSNDEKESRNLPVVGIVRDSAFQFYYPENIDAIAAAGARIVFTSPLTEAVPPPVDALYIGGGFPETHARELSRNETYRRALKALIESDLPVYAECGGLMYLGRELVLEGQTYPMVGALPVSFGLSAKPQGHGYTVLTVDGVNPFFAVGTEIRGHEFHYSAARVDRDPDTGMATVFHMQRGNGIVDRRDGACYKNVLATYTHIHALGVPQWADALVRNAKTYRNRSLS